MREKKKRAIQKEERISRENSLPLFEENRMLDDHGDAIIGGRDKKPVTKAF